MSLMKDDLIDTHEYEHELIRARLAAQPLPKPRTPLPDPKTWPDDFEADILRQNQLLARQLYEAYSARASVVVLT